MTRNPEGVLRAEYTIYQQDVWFLWIPLVLHLLMTTYPCYHSQQLTHVAPQ